MQLKLSYDGHGLNRADGPDESGDGMPLRGERLITWQRKHRDAGGDYVVPDELADQLGPLLAAAPDMLQALEQCYSDLQRYAPNSRGSILAREAIAKARKAR